MFKRILKDLRRTNNNIETCHKSLAQDIEKQRFTKQLFDEIKAGKFFERCKKERLKNERIKAHLKTYVKSSELDFLDGLIEIFDNKQKEIISND
ncbi:hypothetical protein BpHYR1_006175 [Brachionus plicatilis]|uniref:Uncharacterized protein n=1 Tax=Brachionus plicatilis TaxID=10195 RepID=A0A3M7P3P2_BRAPC|nr:hypothetical protein BpHYR1_006175 [Brachionus plicatilis]